MRPLSVVVAVALVLLAPSPHPAHAEIGTLDNVPAATLLLPYFEVDLDDPDARITTAAIRNASPDPVLAHAVLWTDLGVPTLGFDVLLPGHGSRTLDLSALFGDGSVPASGPSTLPGCAGRLPAGPLSPAVLDGLRAAHSGTPSSLFGDRCAGHDDGTSLVRGYLTVDVTTACTDSLPSEPSYFGLLGFANVLWGEGVVVDQPGNAAHADPLVHLQASSTDPATAAGRPTFYGRYTGATAADHREALPDQWGLPFWEAGGFDTPEYEIWRDPGVPREPFECTGDPAPPPAGSLVSLGQGVSLRFDDRGFDGELAAPLAGLATQRTTIAQPTVPGVFGWLFLDLDAVSGGPFGTRLQSHVTAHTGSFGRFLTSVGGVHLPLAFGTTVAATAADPDAAERSAADPGTPDPGQIVLGRTGSLDDALDVLVFLSGTATPGTDYQLVVGSLGPESLSSGSLAAQGRVHADREAPAGLDREAVPQGDALAGAERDVAARRDDEPGAGAQGPAGLERLLGGDRLRT